MQSHTDSNAETPQGNLFEARQPSPSPRLLARRTDPQSSHAAAKEVIESGLVAGQMAQLLTWLRGQTEPFTSLEISHLSGMCRYTCARRLPSLEKAGLVSRGPARICRQGGRLAITWKARP
jgi:hypothetical protein